MGIRLNQKNGNVQNPILHSYQSIENNSYQFKLDIIVNHLLKNALILL